MLRKASVSCFEGGISPSTRYLNATTEKKNYKEKSEDSSGDCKRVLRLCDISYLEHKVGHAGLLPFALLVGYGSGFASFSFS